MSNDEQVAQRLAELYESLCRGSESDPYWRHGDGQRVMARFRGIGEPAIEFLIEKLAEAVPQTSIWHTVIHTLFSFGEVALPAMENAYAEADVNTRGAMVLAAGPIGEPALGILNKALDDPHAGVRQLAVEALSDIGEPALDALTKALGDENASIRLEAVRGLGKIGSPALDALARASTDANDDVRLMATRGLGRIGESARAPLVRASTDGNASIRLEAVKGLGNIGEPVLSSLTRAATDENASVRLEAVEGLGKIGEPALDALIGVLDDENASVRLQAVEGLGKIGEPALDALVSALDDKNASIRLEATEGLGKIGELALNALIKASKDKNADVRRLALEKIGQIDSEPARKFLARTVSDLKDYRESLDVYRGSLEELEKESINRWKESSKLARYSYYSSLILGCASFLMGVGITAVGLYILVKSGDELAQIGGGVISALTAIATIANQFWKEPVENIQRFSAKQAYLQVTFIGYMNCLGQIRVVFDNHSAKGETTLDDLEKYQKMLSEAMTQASQQLIDQDQRSRG